MGSPGTFGYAKDSAQYTKCGLIVQGNGFVTCKNPRVTWGKHTGYPHKHSNNNFNNYCKSLGYTAGAYGTPKYGTVKCSKGALFWCKGYDNPKAYHWCDWQDGRWKNNGVDYRCLDNRALIEFSCKGKNHQEIYWPESVRVRQGLWAVHQVRSDRDLENLCDVQEPTRDVGQAHRVPAQAHE